MAQNYRNLFNKYTQEEKKSPIKLLNKYLYRIDMYGVTQKFLEEEKEVYDFRNWDEIADEVATTPEIFLQEIFIPDLKNVTYCEMITENGTEYFVVKYKYMQRRLYSLEEKNGQVKFSTRYEDDWYPNTQKISNLIHHCELALTDIWRRSREKSNNELLNNDWKNIYGSLRRYIRFALWTIEYAYPEIPEKYGEANDNEYYSSPETSREVSPKLGQNLVRHSPEGSRLQSEGFRKKSRKRTQRKSPRRSSKK
jgi:hypothetical protein